MKIRIFYAGLLYQELSGTAEVLTFKALRISCGSEIYNGAYTFIDHLPPYWYRMDGTPCLLSDVPKELQILNLLL